MKRPRKLGGLLPKLATRIGYAFAVVTIAWPAQAFAAVAAGGALPWDGPLTTLQNDLQGPVAHAITTAAVIGTGIMWSVSEHGTGVRKMSSLAFGGSCALGATQLMTTLFPWAERFSRTSTRTMTDRRINTIHRSLTQPILLAGAERSLAIANWITAAALIFGGGLHWYTIAMGAVLLTVGHWALVQAAKFDPQLSQVYIRHIRYQNYYPARSPLAAAPPLIHTSVPTPKEMRA